MRGCIAQLVEHRTGIAEVTGSNPVEVLIFFMLLLSHCLNWKILDVFSIYSFQVSSFMYLYHNDVLPISFTRIFQTGNQIHQYSTRYSDYYRPHTCRTNIKKFSILFQGPRIWNSLPIDIKNAPTFSIFKRTIKSFLRLRQNAT